ncbi:MAG: class I SAM-dependent methyltransferase [Frankiaceae bacterium]
MSFGAVADRYDHERAGYPGRLLDDVTAHAGLRPGDVMVEIGAGTGIATRGFMARGLAVHVVEPSREMADVLLARAERIAGAIRPTVEVVGFESWRPRRRYQLLAAAQSWHWIDPAVRYRRAREALVGGGTIALLGHRLAVADPALRRQVDAVRAAHAPAGQERAPYHSTLPYHPELATELATAAPFRDVEHRTYRFSERYEPARLHRLLTTMSDHIVLPAPTRALVEDELRALLSAAGETITVDYRTDLYLARAA